MARDHARVNLAIWQDPDWRQLPPPAQHLYLVLWTHPDLSYAGVVDWRPGRLTPLAGGWTRADVEAAADCLEARLFIVRDIETEECLIRSWVRWDGLLKQPVMAVSFANAYAAVASNDLRKVIVHEAVKLRDRESDLAGWKKDQVRDLLTHPTMSARDRDLPDDPLTPTVTPSLTPSATPDVTPQVSHANPWPNPSPKTPPTPSPTPSPSSSSPARLTPRSHAASLLGWQEEDERLDYLGGLLRSRGVGSARPWLTRCHETGDLERLLTEQAAHDTDPWGHLPVVGDPPPGDDRA